MQVVLADGCFDLLHVGHIRHLREARAQGDVLIVAVTKDGDVGKTGRPIIPLAERIEMLAALQIVSSAFPVRDSLEALEVVKPNVFCKGHDYYLKGLLPEEIRYCAEHRIRIHYTQPNPQTTSGIIERINTLSLETRTLTTCHVKCPKHGGSTWSTTDYSQFDRIVCDGCEAQR